MNMDEKKHLIFLAVICGAIFCIEVVVGWNLSSENSAIRYRLSKLEERETSALKKKQRIPEMTVTAEDLAQIVSEYTEILPQEDEVRRDAFVDTITNLCKESGLTITGAEPVDLKVRKPARGIRVINKTTVPVSKPFQRHKYRFEMTGEFNQFHRFLNSVENHPRFLRVDGFDLFPVDRSDDLVAASQPLKQFTIEISTYVYEEKTVSSKEVQ